MSLILYQSQVLIIVPRFPGSFIPSNPKSNFDSSIIFFSGILKMAKWSSGLVKKLILFKSDSVICVEFDSKLKYCWSIENNLNKEKLDWMNSLMDFFPSTTNNLFVNLCFFNLKLLINFISLLLSIIIDVFLSNY